MDEGRPEVTQLLEVVCSEGSPNTVDTCAVFLSAWKHSPEIVHRLQKEGVSWHLAGAQQVKEEKKIKTEGIGEIPPLIKECLR